MIECNAFANAAIVTVATFARLPPTLCMYKVFPHTICTGRFPGSLPSTTGFSGMKAYLASPWKMLSKSRRNSTSLKGIAC